MSKMDKMDGFATINMRMSMSTSTLPIHGECHVEDCKVTLKFPFTAIGFDLPSPLKEDRNDFDFKIGGAGCGNFVITIGYVKELKCFTGVGKQEEATSPDLTFCFYPSDSPMNKLPKV